jgi:ParB-like nuclease domain/DNA methylase
MSESANMPSTAAAEWVPTGKLKPWAKNPRKNDGEPVAKVAESIKRFGFGAPIVARRETQEIIAGHTRWKAARQLKLDQVPVRYLDISERDARLLALADNRLGELAEWDTPELHAILATYDLGDSMLAGWTERDMRALERTIRAAQSSVDDDPIPEPPAVTVTQPGDLWTLGRHRLVCSEASDARALQLAQAALQPAIMVTDLPRDVSPTGPRQAFGAFAGHVVYAWYDGLRPVAADMHAAGFEPRASIVWDRGKPSHGRGHYHRQHELCLYAVRRGHAADWAGDAKQSTVWTLPSTAPDDESPTARPQKPVECAARPIRNHGAPHAVVLDPYAGSGNTLIAAEQLDRVCVALEASPAYCDVIVERWQRITGGKAQRG